MTVECDPFTMWPVNLMKWLMLCTVVKDRSGLLCSTSDLSKLPLPFIVCSVMENGVRRGSAMTRADKVFSTANDKGEGFTAVG